MKVRMSDVLRELRRRDVRFANKSKAGIEFWRAYNSWNKKIQNTLKTLGSGSPEYQKMTNLWKRMNSENPDLGTWASNNIMAITDAIDDVKDKLNRLYESEFYY